MMQEENSGAESSIGSVDIPEEWPSVPESEADQSHLVRRSSPISDGIDKQPPKVKASERNLLIE